MVSSCLPMNNCKKKKKSPNNDAQQQPGWIWRKLDSVKKASNKRLHPLCTHFYNLCKMMKLLRWRKDSFQFSCSVRSNSLWTHGPQHAKPPCPSPTPGVYSNSCSLSRWCHPTISSSVIPFSCPQSFPASRSFQMSQFFASGGQSNGVSASASVFSMSIQGWFPLGFTGLIILISNWPSRIFSSTRILFGTQSLYGLTLTSMHNYWKNHSFDYTDLCQQSDISAF